MRRLLRFLIYLLSLPLLIGTQSLTFAATSQSAHLAEDSDSLIAHMQSMGANVIFMRHAIAPGFGDPDNFQIDDCSTQRNLSESGREQAKAIGVQFKRAGLSFSEIRSSQWCRCKETSELLDLGEWQTFSGLNSFFQGYANRAETLAELEAYLRQLKPNDRVLLVTHQVVISAITGISPSSGGLVLYNSQTSSALRWSNK